MIYSLQSFYVATVNAHRFIVREISPNQIWQVTNRQSSQMALVHRQADGELISSTGERSEDDWACQVVKSHLALANRTA